MSVLRGPLGTVGLGVCLVVLGVWTRSASLRSRHWPSTPGVISASYVSVRSGGKSRTGTIEYRYTVEGRTYTGSLLSFGKTLFESESTTVARYPQGAQVDVFYDPKDPALAVLDPGAAPGTGLALLAGIGLVGYGVWRGLAR